MTLTRRQILATLAGAVALAIPRRVLAFGGLEGSWIVRCQNGHDDPISGITQNHRCSAPDCGLASVSDGGAWVVCPRNREHCDWVDGITRQHECDTCHAQCRRD